MRKAPFLLVEIREHLTGLGPYLGAVTWGSFVFYFGMVLKIDVLLFLWEISDHSWDTLFPEDLGEPEWHMSYCWHHGP